MHRHSLSLLAALLVACADDGSTPRMDAQLEQPAGEADAALAPDAATPSDASLADALTPAADAAGHDEPGKLSVARYDYTLDLTTWRAQSSLQLAFDAPGIGCAALRSHPALSALEVRGAQATASQQGDDVKLCGALANDPALSVHAELTVPQTRDAWTGVGVSTRSDRAGHSFRYLLSWLEQCPRFGPCDPDPAALSHYTFTVRHDEDQLVLCPGIREASTGHTRCSLLGTRAPSYSAFMVAAHGGWQVTPLLRAADVNVILYESAEGQLRTLLDRAAIGRFLSWLTQLLGPFPYGDELRIASAPVQWLGMEHPANIIVRDDLPSLVDYYQDLPLHTVLHEIAHQWAGNRVTLASTLDFAWKEAVTEYLVYSFEERERGPSAALGTRRVWQRTGNNAQVPVRPLHTPNLPLAIWAADVTGSGPMTLFLQLEAWFGREALLRAIASFLQAPGARSMLQLQQALEQSTGRSLQRYFDAWIYGTDTVEWPVFHVATRRDGDQLHLELEQRHAQGVRFPCVVELEIQGDTLRERLQLELGLDGDQTRVSTTITFAESVRAIRIDPDARLLDWSINTWHSLEPLRFHP